jgi:hypothetical protein
MKRIVVTAALLLALAALWTPRPAPAGEKDGEWIKLFNGKDLSGWRVFLDPRAKDADPHKVFTVHEGIIACTGKPYGYLITEKEYSDYVLKVQWRWIPDPKVKGRNSGVFVHVVGPDKIWPKAVEAQLMADHAGDFWLVDNFKLKVDPKRQDRGTPRHYLRMKDHVEKEIGEWNQYEITCKGDTVRLVVNGQLVNEGTQAELTKGKILLQSEGAPIEFKDVVLKHASR